MKRVLCLILVLTATPLIARHKNHLWISGTIRLVSTDEWCGSDLSPLQGTCGLTPPATTFGSFSGATIPMAVLARPTTQLIEIDGPDWIYIVKRIGLDGGVRVKSGSAARFAVEGDHVLLRLAKAEDRTEIVEMRRWKTLAEAVQQQLGLKLEQRKGPVSS